MSDQYSINISDRVGGDTQQRNSLEDQIRNSIDGLRSISQYGVAESRILQSVDSIRIDITDSGANAFMRSTIDTIFGRDPHIQINIGTPVVSTVTGRRFTFEELLAHEIKHFDQFVQGVPRDEDAAVAWVNGIRAALGLPPRNGYLDATTLFGGENKGLIDFHLGDPDGCFLGSAMVSMWPMDMKPDAKGRYDQDEVRSKIWEKPIRDITVEDWIVSYDKDGLLIPGRVTRTMVNHSKHILDVFGLMVTPGHVTLCGDGKFAGQHVPILDILRSDGALVKTDGSKVRAATNFPVGSPEDQLIWAVTGEPTQRGVAAPIDHGQIRLGTRIIALDEHGKMKHQCIAEIIREMDLKVTEDGLLRRKVGDQTPAPFHWVWSMSLPNPEDYVLSRTDLTLEDIYRANEWEVVKPKMPTPSSIKSNAIASQPMMHAGTAALSAGVKAPQVPMSMHKASNQPTMSRKQRRAQEKKMRQAAKANKVLVTAGH